MDIKSIIIVTAFLLMVSFHANAASTNITGGYGPKILDNITGAATTDNGIMSRVNDGSYSVLPNPVAFNQISDGLFYNPKAYGATCEGYQGISSSSLSFGGSGYQIGDTFYITNTNNFDTRYATGVVTDVSGGVVTNYSITYVGAGYAVTSAATVKLTGNGTGLTINITGNTAGHDDTTAFAAALAASRSSSTRGAVLVPHGCYVSSLTMPSHSALVGPDKYAGYSGYNPAAHTSLFVIGSPSYFLNIAADGQTISGFQIAGSWQSRSVTTLIGSPNGNTGTADYGARISNMSLDMGLNAIGGNTSGHLFNIYADHNYMSTSTNGIYGAFSDSLFETNTGAGNSVTLLSDDWGGHRFLHNRWEWGVSAYNLQGRGFVEINDDQIDEMTGCSVVASGSYNILVRGGFMRGGGGGGSFLIKGAANNGSGLVRLTVDSVAAGFYNKTATSFLSTGDTLVVTGVQGTTEANGTWVITKIDGTHVDLQGSSFSNTYSSGGAAGKPNADAFFCLNGASAKGLSVDGTAFFSPLGGDNVHGGTSYLADVQSSGTNNPNIRFVNIPHLTTGYTADDQTLMGFINWQNGAASSYEISGLGAYGTKTYGSFKEDGAGNITFSKGVYETSVNLGASLSGSVNIDLKQGSVFYGTVAGNTTFSVINAPPSGTAASFALKLSNLGAHTISWSNGLWAGGTAPTFSASGTDWLGGLTNDGGSTITYWLAIEDAR